MGRFEHLEFDANAKSTDLASAAVSGSDEKRHLQKAQEGFAQGNFEQALRDYSKVLEFNPFSPEAWVGQARMLIELEEYREASLWADKGLEKLPHCAELLAAKAVTLARLGDTAAALTYSDNAMAEKGETSYIWLSRGDVLLSANESRYSDCFERAFQLDPTAWLLPWLASRICAFYEKLALALKHAQKAIELDATRAIAWAQLGLCQLGLNLPHLAEKSFHQARELDSRCEGAYEGIRQLAQMSPWKRFSLNVRRLFSA
jgi:tetratricopeptide (TPR) repeat protein